MTEDRMRAFELAGRRRGIRLDEGTWKAIDWIAEQKGVRWAELARIWAESDGGTSEGDSLTRTIRSAAMRELLAATIFSERAELHAEASPFWRRVSECSDEDFAYACEQATITESADLGGFKLSAGLSEFGNVTFYIENNFREGSHAIVSTPFTPEEWSKKTGDE